jgi:hypothetical protein
VACGAGTDVAVQAGILMVGGWALALYLDNLRGHTFPTLTCIALFGTFISYIYSAPPLKLKANGWQGTYALGASYIALPWWAGQALFGELSLEVRGPSRPQPLHRKSSQATISCSTGLVDHGTHMRCVNERNCCWSMSLEFLTAFSFTC